MHAFLFLFYLLFIFKFTKTKIEKSQRDIFWIVNQKHSAIQIRKIIQN